MIKLENIAEELAFAYEEINGVPMPRNLPTPDDKYGEMKKWKQLQNIPYSLVISMLSLVYGDDYKAFGYEMPSQELYLSMIKRASQ